jgi:excisionase family DNA binding protein
MATRGIGKEVPLAATKSTDWLTTEEVAVLCGMTHSRVCQLLRSKQMNGEQGRGRIWRIQRREAEKFREQPDGAGRPRRAS